MSTVPVRSGREVAQAFVRLGWTIARDRSHIVLVREGHPASLSVPNYREVARGTLRSLIRKVGVSVEDFVRALD
ncbi:MAG: type II toxin-antitoxin system HicA family toxin [Planctomycetota bacterium]